eukprot:m.144085 g.144085  ORF g.144085 m.144085 type:complete len:101 (-) comp23012_c0_seq8:176-478(-)
MSSKSVHIKLLRSCCLCEALSVSESDTIRVLEIQHPEGWDALQLVEYGGDNQKIKTEGPQASRIPHFHFSPLCWFDADAVLDAQMWVTEDRTQSDCASPQ